VKGYNTIWNGRVRYVNPVLSILSFSPRIIVSKKYTFRNSVVRERERERERER
jgi:hypothetical protein